MLDSYVLLDLETTGGNPVADRIIEVAALRVEEGREVARWSTLVNPGSRIPAFITGLTGIDDAMVADAPTFDAVAQRVLELLEGSVLVAHNVRFDHGFLKNEFARLQIDLRVRMLCTVRLSRRLYPQHKGHGLDAITRRHGLHNAARHRAMGDVDTVQAWLQLAMRELGPEPVRHAASGLLGGGSSLPPHLETALAEVPDTCGVYLLYGDGPLPLYVGKSVRLRSRVAAHFQSDHTSARDMRLAQETRRIEFRRTAGELGALLLETRLVRQLHPAYNRALQNTGPLWFWTLAESAQAMPQLGLCDGDAAPPGGWGRMYGVFRTRKLAHKALGELAREHGLCPRLLGLESGVGRCFAHQLGTCRGACCGAESVLQHHLRLQTVLFTFRLQAWPYEGTVGWREHDADSGHTDIHLFDQWRHVATVHDEAQLHDALQQTDRTTAFDLATYRLLVKRLGSAARPAAGLLHFPRNNRESTPQA